MINAGETIRGLLNSIKNSSFTIPNTLGVTFLKVHSRVRSLIML